MNSTGELRRGLYGVIIVAATFIAAAKVAGVENVWEPSRYPGPRRDWPAARPLPTPMFGSNDKSRWLTVRALVDHGTFAIGQRGDPNDPATDTGLAFENGWTTVDKVKNPATQAYYSSKPPLYAVMLAGQYWLLKTGFGLSIVDDRWPVVIICLLTWNVLPFAISLVLLARMIEVHGRTDFGRVLAFSVAAFGTFVITFSNTLNNHTPAACCVVFALYPLLRRRRETNATDATEESNGNGSRPVGRAGLFASGFFAALAATFDLPAAAFAAMLLGVVFLAERSRAVWMAAGMVIPVAAFFATNYAALGQALPAYSEFGGPWYNYPGSHWARLEEAKRGTHVPGIDFARESRGVYLFHCLAGHHGWFSLTPAWLIGLAGIAFTLRSAIADLGRRAMSLPLAAQLAFALTIVLTVFFVYVQRTNNYGGNTSCLRWFLWLTPLWVLAVIAGADRLARFRLARGVMLLCFGMSVFSAFYPAWNPWRSPWLMVLMERLDWVNYEKP